MSFSTVEHRPQFAEEPSPAALQAVSSISTEPYWLDRADRPAAGPSYRGDARADLVIVGGGYTGLWAAYLAAVRDPGRRIVLLESGRIAEGASGRNGGFVSPSLTHGLLNGINRFPDEISTILRLGHESLDAMEQTIADEGIACDFVRAGELDVAMHDHQLEDLQGTAALAAGLGEPMQFLDAAAAQRRVHAPEVIGGLWDPSVALVDPARLAWGLLDAVRRRGVEVFEHSPVLGIDRRRARVDVRTPAGTIRAGAVALATNAYPPLLSRMRHYVVPVYDYALMTEPLTSAQWEAIGWSGREGMSDVGNRFHYFRPTSDGRILWGGYNAVYHRGFSPEHEHDLHEHALLATHLLEFLPQLEGIRFSHGWGGAIDTCSRFSPFWGTAHGGRTAYVAGYTGLGVGAARFGAQVMLDLLDHRLTEATELSMVQTKPLPFPPEPLRSVGISWTTRSLAEADRNGGRRNLWLRTLDRVGLGFDS